MTTVGRQIKRTEVLLKECSRIFAGSEQYTVFHPFFQDAKHTHSQLESELRPYKNSSGSGKAHLSLPKSLWVYLNRETFSKLLQELRHHELTLDLIYGLVHLFLR